MCLNTVATGRKWTEETFPSQVWMSVIEGELLGDSESQRWLLSSMASVQAEVKYFACTLSSGSFSVGLFEPFIQIEIKMFNRDVLYTARCLLCSGHRSQTVTSLFVGFLLLVCCFAPKSQQQPSNYLSVPQLTRM